MKTRGYILGVILVFLFGGLWGIYALNTDQGEVRFEFVSQPITIMEPQNTTYNFEFGDNFSIFINASSTITLSSWSYTLEDLRHEVSKSGNFSIGNGESNEVSGFINAYRWENKLTIFARDINNQEYSASVWFYVNVSNTAPLIEIYSPQVLACENNYLDAYFTAYDADGDVLQTAITPVYPFYTIPFLQVNSTNLIVQIYSGILNKAKVGNYPRIISVNDGEYSDSKNINVTVIEINNAPFIEPIGVQTIWARGVDSLFDKTVQVMDTEDGNQDSGNLNFSVSFSGRRLFEIMSNGSMLFTPLVEDVGVHNITVCAEDKGLNIISPNISFCNQTGEKITTCENFSLTVTNENRAPTIINYYPEDLNLSFYGDDRIYFNITKYDPDFTIPDSYWFVDGVFKKYYSGRPSDFFNYSFGCGVSGWHNVTVEITDGLLNDSLTWDILIYRTDCPVPTNPPSGGGGGMGGMMCTPKLGCEEWATCQNSKESLISGVLSGDDYREIKDKCDKRGLDDINCGFQLRGCTDFSNCTKIFPRSLVLSECIYTLNPGCSDGIENCHDGSCELLVDCGGPCQPCPTCSDGISNQNELGVDCGGPCPIKCEEKRKPNFLTNFLTFLGSGIGAQILFGTLIVLIAGGVIFLIVKIYLIKLEKRRLLYKYFKDKHE